MSSIKISIITATLNSSSNIESLIKSVIPHISNEIEFIIIDGKSTDATIDIIKKYSNFLHHWESSYDQGIYDAFNKGIKIARGEFVSFVGSDDVLLDNYSGTYLDAINKNPEYNYLSSKAILNNKEIGKNFNYNQLKNGMKAIHPGSLHKKSLFDFYGFYNISYKVASDYEFLIKCGYSLKNYFINKPTIVMGPNGISNLNYLLTLKEEYEIKSNNNLNNFFFNIFNFFLGIVKKKITNLFKNDF
jgi:glycosyltransferase involved in cell wall biosynthesis